MNLTRKQKNLCEQVINVFESGMPNGNYSAIGLMDDGPVNTKQISYGKSQTTEFGKLKDLLKAYIAAGGRFKDNFTPYMHQIGITQLSKDKEFIALLKAAGTDKIMQETQDKFFDEQFFNPAMKWADDNGFTLPLSALVIYDSFIHSGGILKLLRNKFEEPVPAKGGDEKEWIKAYTQARRDWLRNHSNRILRNTAHRSSLFLSEAILGNWELTKPLNVQGYTITG